MFVSSRVMIQKAAEDGYAVPAFNAENLEMVQAAIGAAVASRSPVIIQTTAPTVRYLTAEEAFAMVSAMAQRVDIPVALHLDHCTQFDGVMAAIGAGYTSVMFDGSALPFSENVEITRRVVEVAHPMGITVEAELGAIGGKEDGVSGGKPAYTDPQEAAEFAAQTGVDLLAVAIGTAHGFYHGEPKLDFDRIAAIRKKTQLPLVLHGGSGVPEASVKRAISLGMAKVNFATELRAAATAAVRTALEDPALIDPKKFMGPARDAVYQLCQEKIAMCGSVGRG